MGLDCCAVGYVGDAGVQVVGENFFPEVVLVVEAGGGFEVAA